MLICDQSQCIRGLILGSFKEQFPAVLSADKSIIVGALASGTQQEVALSTALGTHNWLRKSTTLTIEATGSAISKRGRGGHQIL